MCQCFRFANDRVMDGSSKRALRNFASATSDSPAGFKLRSKSNLLSSHQKGSSAAIDRKARQTERIVRTGESRSWRSSCLLSFSSDSLHRRNHHRRYRRRHSSRRRRRSGSAVSLVRRKGFCEGVRSGASEATRFETESADAACLPRLDQRCTS